MPKKLRILVPVLLAAGLLIAVAVALAHSHFQVLSPAGTVAHQQRTLLIAATLLMLLIVLPVFGLTFFIAWKYRAGNEHADYQPEWDHNRKLETLWWGLPCLIIGVLAVLAWTTSHSPDPSRTLQSRQTPMTIQVVALQWKWLFLYPEQHIATLNYVQFPAGRPVDFQITADAPMNSFWIPRLGGQIYAMSGMSTHLNLMADKPGSYAGSSANISGSGFSSMRFTATSRTSDDFDHWVSTIQAGSHLLSTGNYDQLARPSIPSAPAQYAYYQPGLYDSIMMKYMTGMPSAEMHHD